jgi:hypothetical protein
MPAESSHLRGGVHGGFDIPDAGLTKGAEWGWSSPQVLGLLPGRYCCDRVHLYRTQIRRHAGLSLFNIPLFSQQPSVRS